MIQRLAALLALLVSVSGCVVYKDAVAVQYLSITSDKKPGRSSGHIDARDCATTVFGIGRPESDLSINNALARGKSDQGLRYIQNMAVDRDTLNILVYRRTCLIVTGNGHK